MSHLVPIRPHLLHADMAAAHRHTLIRRALHPRSPQRPADPAAPDDDDDEDTPTVPTRRPAAPAASTFEALPRCIRACLTDNFEDTCEGDDSCFCGSPARLRLSAVCVATGCSRGDLTSFMDNVNDQCSPRHANSLVSVLETATGTTSSVASTTSTVALTTSRTTSSEASTRTTTTSSALSTSTSASRASRVTSVSVITSAEATLVVQPIAGAASDGSSLDASSSASSGMSKGVVVGLGVAGAIGLVLVGLCAFYSRKSLKKRSERAKQSLADTSPDGWDGSQAHLTHQRSPDVVYANKEEAETPNVHTLNYNNAQNGYFPAPSQNGPYPDFVPGMAPSSNGYYTHPQHEREQHLMTQHNIRPVSVVSTENFAGVGLRGSSASYQMPSEILAERQRQSRVPSSNMSFPSSVAAGSMVDSSFDVNAHHNRASNSSMMLALPPKDHSSDEGASPLDPFIAQTQSPIIHPPSTSRVASHGHPRTHGTASPAVSHIDITSPPPSASPLLERPQRNTSMTLNHMPLPGESTSPFSASPITSPMTATVGLMAQSPPPMSPRTAAGLRKLHLPDKVRSNSLSTREIASPPSMLVNPFKGGSDDDHASSHGHALTEEQFPQTARSSAHGHAHEAGFPVSPLSPPLPSTPAASQAKAVGSPSPQPRNIPLPASAQGSISSMNDIHSQRQPAAPRSSFEHKRDVNLSRSNSTATVGLPYLREMEEDIPDLPMRRS